MSDYDRILQDAENKVFNIEIQRNNDPLIQLAGTPTDVYIARNAYYDNLIADVRADAQRRANATESEYNRILRDAENKVFNIEIQRKVDPDASVNPFDHPYNRDNLAISITTNTKYDNMIADVRADAQRRANATLGK
jgi:hypothetical protein